MSAAFTPKEKAALRFLAQLSKEMFTPKEKAALRVLARLQDRGMFVFTIDQFADKFYRKEKRPASWRQNVATMLRVLARKLSMTNTPHYSLARLSGIGRGEVGKYKVDGLIERIVKDHC